MTICVFIIVMVPFLCLTYCRFCCLTLSTPFLLLYLLHLSVLFPQDFYRYMIKDLGLWQWNVPFLLKHIHWFNSRNSTSSIGLNGPTWVTLVFLGISSSIFPVSMSFTLPSRLQTLSRCLDKLLPVSLVFGSLRPSEIFDLVPFFCLIGDLGVLLCVGTVVELK